MRARTAMMAALDSLDPAPEPEPPPGTGPIAFLWFLLVAGIEGLIGRAGLPAVFGSLVAIAAGVGLRGWTRRRDLDRRGVTARALRHERGTRLACRGPPRRQGPGSESRPASRRPSG